MSFALFSYSQHFGLLRKKSPYFIFGRHIYIYIMVVCFIDKSQQLHIQIRIVPFDLTSLYWIRKSPKFEPSSSVTNDNNFVLPVLRFECYSWLFVKWVLSPIWMDLQPIHFTQICFFTRTAEDFHKLQHSTPPKCMECCPDNLDLLHAHFFFFFKRMLIVF